MRSKRFFGEVRWLLALSATSCTGVAATASNGGPASTVDGSPGDAPSPDASSLDAQPVGVGDAIAPDAGGPLPHMVCDAGVTLGAPVTLAPAAQVGSIAIDGTSVYWADPGGGSVNEVSICGGPTVALASGQALPTAVATDGVRVFWTASGTAMASGSVESVLVDGGDARELAGSINAPNTIAVGGASVVWGDNTGGLFSISKSGGTPTLLAEAIVHGIVVYGGNVYFSYRGVSEVPIDADASTSIVTLASAGGPAGIATDGVNIYVAGNSDGTVVGAPIDGGAPTILASGLSSPNFVATDGLNVYVTNGDGTVDKVPVDGGSVVVLASGQSNPQGIEVDDTSVYWANFGDEFNNGQGGAIMKLTPK